MSTEDGSRLRQATLTGSAVLLAVAIAVPMLLVRESRSAAPSRFIVPSSPAQPVIPVTAGVPGRSAAAPGSRTAPPPPRTTSAQADPAGPSTPDQATSPTTPAVTPPPTTQAATTVAPSPPPPAPVFAAGAVIGLEPAASPGHRVGSGRERTLIDVARPGDKAEDRLATRFVVRPGLADPACVSLESAARPGRFLRHHAFQIQVDREKPGDGTFAADATFCPGSDKPGERVTLRSANLPDQYVTVRHGKLVLAPEAAGDAATFVVRPPL
ncbi:AbfB domain-containing protein [Krasilnikovia sp. MM14-A1259]|uniref:AbfB domain-containing protein n=1 Tax=Krasilnikovia sp. MM14-A1259 TaxID=3373539 RepID=UPI0037F28F1A